MPSLLSPLAAAARRSPPPKKSLRSSAAKRSNSNAASPPESAPPPERPANGKGQAVGYVRVSTVEQNTARQLEGVKLDRVFEEKASAKTMDRPQLDAALAYLREGDALLVHSIDRLARNVRDLHSIVDALVQKGVRVEFVKEGLKFTPDRSDPFSTLMLTLLGAVAQFEREIIKERQREGIAVAKREGKYKGRKPSLSDAQKAELFRLLDEGVPKAKLARRFDVTPMTIRNYLKERAK